MDVIKDQLLVKTEAPKTRTCNPHSPTFHELKKSFADNLKGGDPT